MGLVFVYIVGFTPAYAGKILAFSAAVRCCLVHPRIRGEDKPPKQWVASPKGSPPHTRGRWK